MKNYLQNMLFCNKSQEKRLFYNKCFVFIFSEDANPDKFTEFITTINNQLESLFMELRRGRSEDTGDVYYSLVSCILFTYILIGDLQIKAQSS